MNPKNLSVDLQYQISLNTMMWFGWWNMQIRPIFILYIHFMHFMN